MRQLLVFLFGYSPRMMLLAVTAGIITGVSNTGLLAILNQAISFQDRSQMTTLLLGFVGLCVLLPMTRIISAVVMVKLAQQSIFDMRIHLARQILAAPLRKLEEKGANQLFACLTTDVSVLTQALIFVPNLGMQLTIVVSGLVYLFILYWVTGVGVILTLIGGVSIFVLIANRGKYFFGKARDEQDTLFKHFEAIIYGNKELKLHQERRQSFLDDMLRVSAMSFLRNNVKATVYFAGAGSLGQILFFVAIGACVFGVPLWNPSVTLEVVNGYTLVLLYIIGPLESLVGLGPTVSNASVSLNKIQDLGISLEGMQRERESGTAEVPPWQKLEFDGITHAYHREKEDEVFTLGPIDLTFTPGELVFIVGGNGSGKTTLAKMLMGLYFPESGAIRLDGKVIDNANRDTFRQLFTGVFSDFFLFESMLGMKSEHLDNEAREYLRKLHLDHKVKVLDGHISTTDLSQGQRKRLALLTAYLEDRPIYLFDEWAADQDPLFKDIFYKVLLKELKKRGKTVLVISHDDHYYHLADRIVKLDYGQLEFDREQEPGHPIQVYEVAAD